MGKRAMESIIKNYKSEYNRTSKGSIDIRVFGDKVGFLGRVFGCLHRDLSRPFTRGKMGYRSCTECGARAGFDNETFKTYGGFYHPPIVRAENTI